MAFNFPSSPTANQIYTDTATGIQFQYNTTYGVWRLYSPIFHANNQVLYNNANTITGNNGLVFEANANTLWANTVNVTGYIYGNGAFLRGVTSLGSSANNQVLYNNSSSITGNNGLIFNTGANTLYANTINVTGYIYGNGAFLTGISATGGGGLSPGANLAIFTSDNTNAALYIVQSGNKPAFHANTRQNTYPITIDANGNVAIGNLTTSYALQVFGSFAAQTKSFVIDHPTKPGMKLRYASLEGPENGVYIRGRSKETVIRLPDYWTNLIDYDTITVNLTPVGHHQHLYVSKIEDNLVYVSTDFETFRDRDYYYTVYAERKDVEKLVIEI